MADHLDRLGLRKHDVEARVQFLKGRANTHRIRAEETDNLEDWQRAALWGAVGNCMAQSASLSMLSNELIHTSMLREAALAFLNAELPYGVMLESMASVEVGAKDSLSYSRVETWLSEIDQPSGDAAQPAREGIKRKDVPASLATINQRLYLCMGIMGSPDELRRHAERLKRMIDQMKPHPNIPHGPQSQPLHVQLDIIEPVFNAMIGRSTYEDRNRSVLALQRLAFHYAESIESARHNKYLWENLWSPVEYLDLEIVYAAKCIAKVFDDIDLATVVDPESIAAIPLLLAAEPRSRPRPRSAG
jgi:hypothetical protein